MKKEKRRAQAYFTVEASLVLPIVIASLVFTICFLLFCYNRCLMEQDVAMLSVRTASYGARSVGTMEPKIGAWQKEYLTDKYYAWEMEDYVMSYSGNKRTITRSGKLLMGDRLWKASAESEITRVQPVTFVRLCRRLDQNGEAKQ